MLQINPVSLSFNNAQSYLEPDYLSAFLNRHLGHLRFCHFVAILFLTLWTYFYILYYPDLWLFFLKFKMVAIIPMFVIGFFLTYSRQYIKWYQFILGTYVVMVGSYFNALIIISNKSDIAPLIYGITFSYIFNYTFIKARFITATIAGLILYVITMLSLIYLTSSISSPVLISVLLFHGLLNVLGMIIAYTIELSSRREYHLEVELKGERDRQIALNKKLKSSLEEIKILQGILPICSNCKKIRDDAGYWNQIEGYIQSHSDAQFSHSVCPDCAKRLYPDLDLKLK